MIDFSNYFASQAQNQRWIDQAIRGMAQKGQVVGIDGPAYYAMRQAEIADGYATPLAALECAK